MKVLIAHFETKNYLCYNLRNGNIDEPWQISRFLVCILDFMLFLIAVATLFDGGKKGVKSDSFAPFTYTASCVVKFVKTF